MNERPAADAGAVAERLGSRVRSVVEYSPQSSTVHYLRDGIDSGAAESRLVRIEELYQSERLSAEPHPDDPEFGALLASVHLFETAVVVHVVEPSGVVYGISVDHGATDATAGLVRDCARALYGEVPAQFAFGAR